MTVQVVPKVIACRDENYLDLNITESIFSLLFRQLNDGKNVQIEFLSRARGSCPTHLSH